LDKAIIIDTDIASAFSKIERLDLLLAIFSHHLFFITPRIFEELSVPLDFGYTFPLAIFNSIEVLYPTEDENEVYQDMLLGNKSLGKGELEAISICKSRGFVFSSMDLAALRLALSLRVEILDLHSILQAFWKSGIKTKDEVKAIIKELEDKDNTLITDSHLIFK
jgi:predicted nucleic acid-binding protein